MLGGLGKETNNWRVMGLSRVYMVIPSGRGTMVFYGSEELVKSNPAFGVVRMQMVGVSLLGVVLKRF